MNMKKFEGRWKQYKIWNTIKRNGQCHIASAWMLCACLLFAFYHRHQFLNLYHPGIRNFKSPGSTQLVIVFKSSGSAGFGAEF
jgi:hypothetical protein